MNTFSFLFNAFPDGSRKAQRRWNSAWSLILRFQTEDLIGLGGNLVARSATLGRSQDVCKEPARCVTIGRSQDVCEESRFHVEGERCVVSSDHALRSVRSIKKKKKKEPGSLVSRASRIRGPRADSSQSWLQPV
jgi:hypothetical protein